MSTALAHNDEGSAAQLRRDEAAWVREITYVRGRGTAWWVAAFLPITGLMDPWMLPSPTHLRWSLVGRGLAFVVAVAFLRVTRDFAPVREHPMAWLVPGAALLSGIGGLAVGTLGGLDEPWLYLGYLLPMSTVPLPMWPKPRWALVCGLTLMFWLGACAARPELLTDLRSLSVIGASVFGVMLAVLFGHLLWRGEREAFRQGWKRDRLGEALARTNRELTARVQARTAELRRTLARLEDVREEERRDLAGLLHDELGQQLTALRLVASLPPGRAKVSLESRVDALQASAERVLKRLRPRVLESLGLRAAVDELVVTVVRPAGITAEVSLADEIDGLSAALALDVYRVLQEGVVNVVRHAKATRLLIAVTVVTDAVQVAIEDDGVGLSARRPGGMGLAGIEDRAHARGGRVELTSARMGGLRLAVRLPRRRLT